MAGDWIKMRACLATDPKVMAIGRSLQANYQFSRWVSDGASDEALLSDGALRHLVTGALHNVWCNANEHASLDTVTGADLEWVEQVCGVPGMGEAMVSVGWLEVTKSGLRFPKFNSHNTSGSERQRRYRLKKRNERDVTGDVTGDVTSRPREEKRREDINTPPIVPQGTRVFSLDGNGFIKPTVEEVAAYCRERQNRVKAKEFWNFYESKGWHVGKSPMKDWQAKVREWEESKGQGKPESNVYKPPPGFKSTLDATKEDIEEHHATINAALAAMKGTA